MLLFGFSEYGDVTQFLSGYYDTNIGLKTEADSYRKIAADMGIDPDEILFLTDVERGVKHLCVPYRPLALSEARASAEAGMQVKIVVRDGNAPLTSGALRDFPTITSFAQM
uniref:Enolase-phosphatase E1 n=1 Tax=Plectus sambesii TaxID=2011161 RepID=A0A914UP65_9BILA